MKAYYAHCMAIYSTTQEDRDIETIENLGFEVLNPNNPSIAAACNAIRERFLGIPDIDVSSFIMREVFRPLVESCDVFVFRALPDGAIPAGVAGELRWALEFGKPVIELPSAIARRSLSVEATREYLKEIGQR